MQQLSFVPHVSLLLPIQPPYHMLCNSSCFHFILQRTAQYKYIENTTTRLKNIKLTHKCPMTHCISSGKEFLHNLANQCTFPCSCHWPEIKRIIIKDTFLTTPMTLCDERVNCPHLCTLLSVIFLLRPLYTLFTHCISWVTSKIKNFAWNLIKTTRVWTMCVWVAKIPCLPRQWNS